MCTLVFFFRNDDMCTNFQNYDSSGYYDYFMYYDYYDYYDNYEYF